MRFRVLALDYDGTIAEEGRLHSEVRAAIEEIRGGGIAVVLVTGRILDDLKKAAGGLRLFDAVVGEGGAVLAVPRDGRILPLAAPPAPALLEALGHAGIEAVAGRCVVAEFDVIFSRDEPIVFAFHGYPLLIHRLTYRRTNHDNLHVRGYKEEGTTTTPFDMAVLNHLDRFHLVADVIDCVPGLAAHAAYARQAIRDKLIEHKQYIAVHGEDMPEVRDWRWSLAARSGARRPRPRARRRV